MPRLIRFERVGSTQDEIHRLASEGAASGLAVVADEQLRGRGARGSSWLSPRGGLWLSVLLRPPAGMVSELLSLRVALATCDVLDQLGGVPPVTVKWPNDLMLQERKVGGILCETRWQQGASAWVAVGLGLNVANSLTAELQHTATTLAQFCPGLEPANLVEPLVEAIRRLSPMEPRLTQDELGVWQARDWLRGRRLREPVVGTAQGIGADGALRIRREDGVLIPVVSAHVQLEK